MAATPFLIPAAHALTHRRQRFSEKRSRAVQTLDSDARPPKTEGHVIIVGYGLNGQNLARVLRE
jgi:CPA2 family monovalent cation:H+ antiporter-2